MANPLKARRQHAGVVENQRVSVLQKLRQIADRPVLKHFTRAWIDAEQPRGIARPRGPQRNTLPGQLKIEVVNAHVNAL